MENLVAFLIFFISLHHDFSRAFDLETNDWKIEAPKIADTPDIASVMWRENGPLLRQHIMDSDNQVSHMFLIYLKKNVLPCGELSILENY